MKKKYQKKAKKNGLLRNKVTEEEITKIISRMDWNTCYKIDGR